ncbi:hypothetical protein HHL22_00055 [Hymenobacter sp. RP-2-7]|uniref:Uncharacterized protein n=1 Tax=Hymenobacter polaris TaxID=2682546 RepID=A0A7Y0AA54_9BACT|nr:hypothetical protein [Hymenobacter polaris]NML63592.1 hypothetical protein [Hymenobacter polaris]
MYQNEFSQEFEQAVGQEFGQEFSGEAFEFNPEYLGETSGEAQGESFETSGEMSGELNETLEMELAHELLEVSNEQELNQFLGSLVKKVGGAVSSIARSPIGKALGGALKTVAKKALPIAGGALGTFFGGPAGAAIGSKLGSMAGNLFELELEGLSPEDQEFETARAYVRFANSAVRRAAALQRRGLPPQALVRQALGAAAMQHAPGLLRPRNANGTFRSLNGQAPRRPGYGAPRRPQYGPAVAYGAPTAYGYQSSQYNGYEPAPADEGYDGADYQPDANQNGYAAPPRRHRATRGTWMRRGRTLVIQL